MSCFGQEMFLSHKVIWLFAQLLRQVLGKLRPTLKMVEQPQEGLITGKKQIIIRRNRRIRL
jgi:hypothetical protein